MLEASGGNEGGAVETGVPPRAPAEAVRLETEA